MRTFKNATTGQKAEEEDHNGYELGYEGFDAGEDFMKALYQYKASGHNTQVDP